MNNNKEKRYLHEVVELTYDCELGEQGERALVVSLDGGPEHSRALYMTLVFFNRPATRRTVHTGADYLYFRSVKG